MNQILDENVLRFDHEWRAGDRVKAREIAVAFIETHRTFLEPILMKYTRDMLVKEVGNLRAESRIVDCIIVEMWLLSEYEPQNIVGQIHVTLPLPLSIIEGERNGII
jgi:hypothetical protein